MTVMFCDMKGFTGLSERHERHRDFVKVMNRYLSTMSEPIRSRQGIIDKYIGDAIMAYWGPPFTDEVEEAPLFAFAAGRHDGSHWWLAQRNCPSCSGSVSFRLNATYALASPPGKRFVGSIGSRNS